MRAFLIGVALLFSAAAAQAQGVTERARALVGYLNAELGKSRYKAMTLHNENCTNTCVYTLTSTSFLEVGADRIRIVANIESSAVDNDFSEDMKAVTYLYSLILWGNLPLSASYEDANKFLGDLLNKSGRDGAAVASSNNWTFGSASIDEVGTLPALCKK